MRARIFNLFRWANIIVILLTFVAYLSPHVNPERFWPIAFFGMAYPWLLLLHIFFIVVWLIKRKRYFLFSLATIIMGWNHLNNFVGLHFDRDPKVEAAVDVMTYNIKYLQYALREKDEQLRNDRKKEIIEFFSHRSQDVFLLQEVKSSSLKLLRSGLSDFKIFDETRKGVAILSRYPILDKGVIELAEYGHSAIWADLKIGSHRIRFYNLYLHPNKVSYKADQVIQDGSLNEKETWGEIGGILGQVKQAAKKRSREAEQIGRHIARCPYPVILGGDLNDTPLSYTYRRIRGNLKDAFRVRGSGLGTTYNGSIPALRIDYLLSDPRIEILDCDILHLPYSDHYPMTAKYLLPPVE